MLSGNAYSNVVPGTSTSDTYYNVVARKLKPATAVFVDDLADIVHQPNFRQQLDEQFMVSYYH